MGPERKAADVAIQGQKRGATTKKCSIKVVGTVERALNVIVATF